MGGKLFAEQGAYLVTLARRAISEYLKTGKLVPPERGEGPLSEERGVFVTLETFPGRELRGCIGYPLPIKPLARAVVDNAVNAATGDPRFPEVKLGELNSLVIEVSVLSVPEKIKARSPSEYPSKIKIGEDGLIIRYGYASGLLLPQVPVEWNWNEREFLNNLCQKAGLPATMWQSASVEIEKFQAQIFTEEKPGGKIIEKRLIR